MGSGVVVQVVDRREVLSSEFGVSLKFVPIVVSVVLYRFVARSVSVCVNTNMKLLFDVCSIEREKARIPRVVLCYAAKVLLLLSMAALFLMGCYPHFVLPFALRVDTVVPPFIVCLGEEEFLSCRVSRARGYYGRLFTRKTRTTVMSSHMVLVVDLLRFLVVFLTILIDCPLKSAAHRVLFCITPPLIFVSNVLFGRFNVFCFGVIVGRAIFMPVIGAGKSIVKGTVTSRTVGQGGSCVGPIVQVTITSRNVLFLLPHPGYGIFRGSGVSLLVRNCLVCKRALRRNTREVLQRALPATPLSRLRFGFVCRFRGRTAGHLICLFALSLSSSSVLYGGGFGKKGL